VFPHPMITLFGNNDQPPSLLERLKKSVSKTSSEISARVEGLLAGDRRLDPEQLRRLENALLAADLGVSTTRELLDAVRETSSTGPRNVPADLRGALKTHLLAIINAAPNTRDGSARNGHAGAAATAPPRVVFVVGVNGTGKTTTIGKLAHRLRAEGASVLLCAGDTFRAAAVEQLAIWASRTGAQLIKQKSGADPAAVVYDGLTAALARSVDVVIVDTAGRLHTKSNLMAELEKMKRTAAKLIPGAPHDVLLVLDATTGQNGLVQAREFTAAAGVTGIVLTKLDGTARGGIVVSIVRELGLPVSFVGTGETAEDLVPFDAKTFVNSLFD
jgi:fused signal recognition particle receptor